MLEKVERMVMLKDFYGPLLTDKQQMVLNLYYENDWSLSEIADNMKVSRQAIYDLLKRAEKSLEGYETSLSLVGKFLRTRKQIIEVYALLNSPTLDKQAIEESLTILKDIAELV
jgi:hypothetical protein